MRLKRIIKLARVRYDDLDEGDEFLLPRIEGRPLVASKDGQALGRLLLDEVPACDLTKYPPESVTYSIEGIPEDHAVVDDGCFYFPDCQFDEVETRMI